MTTKEVADKLVEHCRSGRWDLAQAELYSPEAISLEMKGVPNTPERVEGMEAIQAKGKAWNEAVEEFHGSEIEGPLVAGDHFTCVFKMDITYKGAPRQTNEEIAMYRVKDGKIVSEQFFYPTS